MKDKPEAAAGCRLYLITPTSIDVDDFRPRLRDALGAGDVACVQLRLKDADDDTVRAAAEALMPVAQDGGAAFLINDRPDLAAELGADGAHIGQEDMAYVEARRHLGDDHILGVTCHNSRHLAMVAGEQGADYVAFGAFFDTATKAAKTRATPDLLTWWSGLFEIPCVAIGGITVENGHELVQAGADFLAVSSGVWNFPEGPDAAVARFEEIFRGAGAA